jgi:hypothetical protein
MSGKGKDRQPRYVNFWGMPMLMRTAAAFLLLSLGGADAHDIWSNGRLVPQWVKQACCGPDDVHHLRPDQVHRISDNYYMVDGYFKKIPVADALPSQDADYWIFYKDNKSGSQTGVFCFFVPMNF